MENEHGDARSKEHYGNYSVQELGSIGGRSFNCVEEDGHSGQQSYGGQDELPNNGC